MSFEEDFPLVFKLMYCTNSDCPDDCKNENHIFAHPHQIIECCLDKQRVREAIERARMSTVYQKCLECNALVRTVQNVLEEDTLLRELGLGGDE